MIELEQTDQTHFQSPSGTLLLPQGGRLFMLVGDAADGRAIARGGARLLGFAVWQHSNEQSITCSNR